MVGGRADPSCSPARTSRPTHHVDASLLCRWFRGLSACCVVKGAWPTSGWVDVGLRRSLSINMSRRARLWWWRGAVCLSQLYLPQSSKKIVSVLWNRTAAHIIGNGNLPAKNPTCGRLLFPTCGRLLNDRAHMHEYRHQTLVSRK